MPSPITPPPIQSHMTSGWMVTRSGHRVGVGGRHGQQAEGHVAPWAGVHRRRAHRVAGPVGLAEGGDARGVGAVAVDRTMALVWILFASTL